jgi:multisubunit Na+/H+ antiporter MnhE subunit
MQTVELTWRRVLSVWWLIAWRASLGGAIIGFIVGFIIGAVGAVVGLPTETRTMVSLPIFVLLGLYWGVVVVKLALT